MADTGFDGTGAGFDGTGAGLDGADTMADLRPDVHGVDDRAETNTA